MTRRTTLLDRVPLTLIAVMLTASPLLAQGLTPATPETVGLSSERLERLTGALQQYVDDGRQKLRLWGLYSVQQHDWVWQLSVREVGSARKHDWAL